MTQTAVEWLVQKLINRQNGIIDEFPVLSLDELYEQALQMEKEQMIEFAWQYSVDEITKEGLILEFNEKYGGKP